MDAFFTPAADWSYDTRHALAHAQHWQESKAPLPIFTLYGHANTTTHPGIRPLVTLQRRFPPAFLLPMHRFLKENPDTTIHLFGRATLFAYALARPHTGFQGQAIYRPNPDSTPTRVERYLASRLCQTRVPFPALKNAYLGATIEAPRYAPLHDRTPCTRAELGIPADRFVIAHLCVGKNRDHRHQAPWAFDILRRFHSQVHMLLIGQPKIVDELATDFRALIHGSFSRCDGQQSALADVLAVCDCLWITHTGGWFALQDAQRAAVPAFFAQHATPARFNGAFTTGNIYATPVELATQTAALIERLR
jgi:hypothetical protein